MPTRDRSRWTYIGDGVWRQKTYMNLEESEEPMNVAVAEEEPAEDSMNVTEAEGNGNGYEDMSRDDLKAELESRGLDKTGRSKAELIERLQAADKA